MPRPPSIITTQSFDGPTNGVVIIERGRRGRRPYDAEAPIDHQSGADRPCNDGVGVVNRGRGMASPLRFVRFCVRGGGRRIARVGFIDLGRRMRRPYANQFLDGLFQLVDGEAGHAKVLVAQ